MSPDTKGWFSKKADAKNIEFVRLDQREVSQPTLLRANLFTITDDDNKDKDTGIYVTVQTKDNSILLAHVSDADDSNSDSTEYNNGSSHTLDLALDSPGAPQSLCSQFNVHLWITTHGNDTWKLKEARVTLLFSDGQALVASKTSFQLKNNNAAVDFANSSPVAAAAA